MGFPVCYGSLSYVFAVSSGFVHLYMLCLKEKEKRAAVVAKATLHKQGSVQWFRFAANLNFQSVSGLYKNFARMSRIEFEFLINLIGGKNLEKGHSVQESYFYSGKVGTDALIFRCVHFFPQFFPCILLSNFVKMHWVFLVPDYFFSFILSSVHSISQLPKHSRNRRALQIHTTVQDRSIKNGKKERGVYGGDASRCTSGPAQAITV